MTKNYAGFKLAGQISTTSTDSSYDGMAQ